MKFHMKCHSYKQIEYKCEECNYWCGNEQSMEVHIVFAHCANFECGLCEFVGGDSETLKTHLFTCEIYECKECDFRYNTLAEVKHHVCEEHTKGKTFSK